MRLGSWCWCRAGSRCSLLHHNIAHSYETAQALINYIIYYMLIVTLPHRNLVKSTETRQGRLFSTVSHLLARPMLSGFGGGINRHTEGISMSRPPGPVTSHLLRCELSFRMPSFPFKIPFCRRQQNVQWEETPNYACISQLKHIHPGQCVSVCVRTHISHLVLFKVTQSLDDDGAGALVLRVARFQPDNGLRFVHQTLDLPLVLHNAFLLFLRIHKNLCLCLCLKLSFNFKTLHQPHAFHSLS